MKRLGDRYLIEAPLGAGGMGSIFRGRDERLGQAVAIKILKRALLDNPVLRERFRREALSLARLRHPGIVTVLDFGESEGDLYTVLELVSGETLAQMLQRTRAMEIARASRIFDQIVAALEVCHESGIVHRDVKPANVMISGEADRVTLIDFGLARVARLGDASIETLTDTGAVQGTPHYMAPEQCRGEEVGPAGDVYAAGVIFYEILAGALPFQGNDAATFMAQHLFVEPTPLTSVAPHVSAGLAAIVHRSLAKRAEDRPSPRALRAALVAALEGTDPEASAAAGAALRHRVGHRARDERAIGGGAAREDGPREGRVVVWMRADARTAALRGCLGAAGIATVGAGERPSLEDHPIVIVSITDGSARIEELAAAARVIAVDVATPDETTAAIRAGASDMLLRDAPDADLVAKVRRLARRKARA